MFEFGRTDLWSTFLLRSLMLCGRRGIMLDTSLNSVFFVAYVAAPLLLEHHNCFRYILYVYYFPDTTVPRLPSTSPSSLSLRAG